MRPRTIPGLSPDYPGTIPGLSPDHRTTPGLSRDYPQTIPGLSQDYPQIIPGLSRESQGTQAKNHICPKVSCTGLRSAALSRDYPHSVFYNYPGSKNGEADYLPKAAPRCPAQVCALAHYPGTIPTRFFTAMLQW